MISGFLLTRQWTDSDDGLRLLFWVKTDQGPLAISIHSQQSVFFIRQKNQSQAEALLANRRGVSFKSLSLKTFNQDSVSGVYFDSQQQFYRARDQLSRAGVDCFEADIRPTERFLCERFITAAMDIDAEYCVDGVHNVRLQPADYQPQFEVMSLDIETDFETNSIFSIAYVCSKQRKVIMIGAEQSTSEITYVADEKTLLVRWFESLQQLDPDIIIGWNVINFDLRVLHKRAQAFGLGFNLGRGSSAVQWRQSQADSNHHFVLIPGRVVLDGIDTLRSATYDFASFALDSVAQALLGRGKLIDDKSQTDPLYKAREIKRQFFHEKATLAAYNLEDCQLVWEIFEHTNLINFAIERARLTGLEMDRQGGSVAAFDNLYLPRLHRKGYIAPNIGDYQGELSAPGGYVMDSKPGLHQSVLVLDYKSLYPSIIRSFHVDPYARVAAELAPEKDSIEGYDGARFHKQEFILPTLIEGLWEARDEAKKDGNSALSQAIKIIMNSFYGVLGTPGCRLHDSRLTSSITKRGHDIIIQTVKLIEDQGYEVIYGDTDSVFVALGQSQPHHEAAEIGQRLAEIVTLFWQQSLKQQHQIESCLEMEFETHFNPFFMPTVRGSEQGSKKRYAGRVNNSQGEGQIIFKGLEAIRTDWTELARDFQQQLYEFVFDGEEAEEYIKKIVADLYQGLLDGKLIYRKRLHKTLTEYQKNIPPHAQAAIKAEAAIQNQQQPSRYHRKSWVEYVITKAGAQTTEFQSNPLDYDHYVERQLTPIADTILAAIGSSMEAITGQQQELF